MKIVCFAKPCFVAVLLVLTIAPATRAAVLVEDGENHATIVMAKDLPGAMRYAVDDLAATIAKIAGTQAPAVVDSPDQVNTPVTIWVGVSPALKARHPELDLTFSKFEELVVAVRGNDVILAGRDRANDRGQVEQAGTAQAVYAFMHNHLDVRWLWPGELGTDIPAASTISFDDFTWRYAPPLRQRLPRIFNYNRAPYRADYPQTDQDVDAITARLEAEAGDWLRRQHGTYAPGRHDYLRRIRAGHAFTSWHRRFAQTHPEYFALQPDGTRNPFPSKKHLKLDISSPAVIEQIITDAVARWGDDPGLGAMISASPNDGGFSGYCTCDDCKAWDVEEGPQVSLRWKDREQQHVALTDRYVHFWNRVARGLQQRYPDHDVAVGTWAYTAYRTPPVENKLDDNVRVGLVANLPVEPEAQRQRDLQLWEAWSHAASELHWRPNLFHYVWGMPAIFTRKSGEDFMFLAERKMAGIDIDTFMNHWSTQGLSYYVLVRLAWDPFASVDEIVEDYTNRAFGQDAAPYMRDYYRKQEEAFYAFVEMQAGMRRYESTPRMPEVFTAELFEALQADIAQAKAAVRGPRADLYLKRIAFMEVGLNFAMAQINAINAMNTLRQGGGDDVQQTVQQAFQATQYRDQLVMDQLDQHTLNSVYFFGERSVRNMRDFLGPPDASYQAVLDQDTSTQHALPFEWDFRMDPREQGHEDHWYNEQVASQLEWRRLQVTKPWDDQILSDDPVDPVAIDYHGLGWYRTQFSIEPASPGEEIWLHFGAIDESAHIYLNDQLVAEQQFDAAVDRDAWQKPRRFNITEYVQSDQNHLAVAVRSETGPSGITRPATIRRQPQNLVTNAMFDTLQGWSIRPANDAPDSFSSSFLPSKYVGEQALRVEVRDDGKASLRRRVNTPLKKGQFYKVAVRYRQKLARNTQMDIAPLRLRFYGLASDGTRTASDRFWLHGTDEQSTSWQTLANVFKAKRDYENFSLTLFLWSPGVYDIDHVTVWPMDDVSRR